MIMKLADYIGRYWAGAEAIYAVIIAMTFTSVLRAMMPSMRRHIGRSSILPSSAAWPGG